MKVGNCILVPSKRKLGINSININITSLEFLCLDHFGVAMSNLNHDPSWKICKRRDSQRCWDPSKQRFWTRDYKKCPCGERERRSSNHEKEKESKRQLGQSSSTRRTPALKQLERTTSLPNSQSGSRSRPCPPAVSERRRLIPGQVNLKTTPRRVLTETSHRTEITC